MDELSRMERNAAQVKEIARLKKRLTWIPMSEPPDHHYTCVLGDFSPDRQTGIGLVTSEGWYGGAEYNNVGWVCMTGQGPMTHYLDCLYPIEEVKQ